MLEDPIYLKAISYIALKNPRVFKKTSITKDPAVLMLVHLFDKTVSEIAQDIIYARKHRPLRGICRSCDKWWGLCLDGTVRQHRFQKEHCPGSGNKAKE